MSLVHQWQLPNALGCGIRIISNTPLTCTPQISLFVTNFEQTLSRFRDNSLVLTIEHATHGGHFEFPDYCAPMFQAIDCLYNATSGAFDPCVASTLLQLGYGSSQTVSARERWNRLSKRHYSWQHDVRHEGTTLITKHPVALDFGSLGKGLCCDLIAHIIERHEPPSTHGFIDAGGDVRTFGALPSPIRIGLEHPDDPALAIGIASLSSGSLAASSPSRRNWVHEQERVHHIINATLGSPAQGTQATWVTVERHPYSGMLADATATALFLAEPRLHEAIDWHVEYCVMRDANVTHSRHFPAQFFAEK